MKRLLAILLAASSVLVTACAAIPNETPPQAIEGPVEQVGPAQPANDLQPDDLVREFIARSGNPEVAKAFLTDDALRTWRGDVPPEIIDDNNISVAPLPLTDVKSIGDNHPDETTIVLSGTLVGELRSDHSFQPRTGQLDLTFTLKRRADGHYRISVPPKDIVVLPMHAFNSSYVPVSLQFFDPSQRVLVPDIRYVAVQPRDGQPARVLDRLLSGPSEALRGAVTSLLSGAVLRTNPAVGLDGALAIDLTNIGDKSKDERERMAAQIVLSLQGITTSPLRLLVDGQDLVSGHGAWFPSEVPSYTALVTPSADYPGMVVADHKLFSLKDSSVAPVDGPAGTGAYDVVSAAQSIDGSQLAVVARAASGVQLKVGPATKDLTDVALSATTLTRPTWVFSTAKEGSNEVWTVQDGHTVVRTVRTASGAWTAGPVNASELANMGTITQLRLSRDGVRVAAVVSGRSGPSGAEGSRVVIASVVRNNDSVTIFAPHTVQSGVDSVVDVDWFSQDKLVVVSAKTPLPVGTMPVDGLTFDRIDNANLSAPISAVAAAPNRNLVVVDRHGMWITTEEVQSWRPATPNLGPDAIPFYPG